MRMDEVQIVSVTKARRKQPVEDDVIILELPSNEQNNKQRKRKLREVCLSVTIYIYVYKLPTLQVSHSLEDDEVKIIKVSKQDDVVNDDSKSSKSTAPQPLGPDIPVYWTKCDKCGSRERRYHVIEVQPNCHEWLNVCIPLLNENFLVTQLQRIQNCVLWQRLQCEQQLMCKSHSKRFDLNERLLYHTSRAKKEIICAEGLDQRLSNSGSFGRGIYFRYTIHPSTCIHTLIT